MHRRGRGGTEEGRGEKGAEERGGLALRSAMEIPRGYRTRLNVSLEEMGEDDFSLGAIRCEGTAPRSRHECVL